MCANWQEVRSQAKITLHYQIFRRFSFFDWVSDKIFNTTSNFQQYTCHDGQDIPQGQDDYHGRHGHHGSHGHHVVMVVMVVMFMIIMVVMVVMVVRVVMINMVVMVVMIIMVVIFAVSVPTEHCPIFHFPSVLRPPSQA